MRHVDIDGPAMIMSIRVGSISTVPMFKTLSSKMVRSFNVTLIGEDAYMLSGYHADTPITIKAEASSKADSHPN